MSSESAIAVNYGTEGESTEYLVLGILPSKVAVTSNATVALVVIVDVDPK